MQGISQERLLIYLLLLGFLPLVLVAGNYYMRWSSQERLLFALNDATAQAKQKNARESLNKQVKQIYREPDHFYIDKQVETISPLSQEVEAIQKILLQGFHQDEERLKKRLQFLKEQNRVTFTEGSIKGYPTFQETIETLAKPVEVDFEDLMLILSRIEGTVAAEKRPHLIVTEAKIERKPGLTQEVYTLDMKVLKREYLK